MVKLRKKLFTFIALTICSVCFSLGGIYGIFYEAKTAKASVSTEDFYVHSAGIRLVNDKNGTGLRFQVRINGDLFDSLKETNSVAKTGVLFIPEVLCSGELTVGNAMARDIDTTGVWNKVNETEYASTAYIYDIPASQYGNKLIARGYIKYTDETVDYTTVSPATSMSDVAKTATEDQKAQVETYLVDNVTVKFKNSDGSIKETQTYNYGETITPPQIERVPDGYKFKGWCMKNGTAWDFENWTAQGNVSLYATFEQYAGKYIVAESAYETGIDVGGGQQFHKTTEIAPAKGFDNVYKYQSTEYNIHGMNFSSADLTKYSKVSFAVKTAMFNFSDVGAKELSGWMIFTLTQTSTATWDLVVTHNGETVYTKTGLNGAYATNGVYSNNALDAILFGNLPVEFYPISVDGDLTVYVSEVRGMPGDDFTIEQRNVIESR